MVVLSFQFFICSFLSEFFSHFTLLKSSDIVLHFQFTPSYGQQQDNVNAMAHYQAPHQMNAPAGGQSWMATVSQSSGQQAGVQSSGTASTDAVSVFLLTMILL